jgi:hypothetical protein
MKPTCYTNTTEIASSAKLNTYKYNFFNMCDSLSADLALPKRLREGAAGRHHTIKIKIIL